MSAPPPTGRPPARPAESFRHKRVTVAGLGRFGGGVGVTRWLARIGARVTVSDIATADDLAESLRALDGLDVTLHLGGHDEADFLDTDLLVVNPAIPKDHPLVAAADAAGVPRSSEMNLFLERCRARMVGITGTIGKSTTTAMIGAVLGRRFTTHVGGNIGRSLLESLEQIRPDHVVVLELSSFQLNDVPLIGVSPRVALVTNLRPNHINWHKTPEAYFAAKKNIFLHQSPDDVLILNRSDERSAAWAGEAPGRVEFFDPAGEPFALRLPGAHNQANAQAAWAAARCMGVDRAAAAGALGEFAGLPHRLEFVAERDRVRYYNDSKSTTPEGAVVALEAFEPGSVVLLAGGSDKGVGFEALGAAAAGRAKAVVVFGQTRGRIAQAVRDARRGASPPVELADDLPAALSVARSLSGPGDNIVLSPACASFDQFVNYEQRGELFVRLVTR